MSHILGEAFIYLLAALVSVPLAKYLGLGSVLGYLVAGVVIGPPLLGLVQAAGVRHFAEFGVVMMLFLIGLELRPSLLWRLRGAVFGLGGVQVIVTAAAILGIGMAFGWTWQSSIAIGLILAMSSTAIVLQTLAEKGLLKSRGGQACFSVLLMQDLAVIPILAILPLLAIDAPASAVSHGAFATLHPAFRMALTIGSVLAIVLAGRYLVRPAFHILAGAKLRELFTAGSLLLIIGIAWLMELVGLSPALGAFVGGVVLAESEYRHEIEADIEPFKGLLLGLFFIAVGAGIDFKLVASEPAMVIGLVAGLVILKLIVLLVVAKLGRLEAKDRWLFAFALAQGGEFCFVLLGMAETQHVLNSNQSQLFTAVVALSMAVTPLLFVFYERFVAPRFKELRSERDADKIVDSDHPVILIGFGRFGHLVGRFLRAQGVGVTVLDNDADQVELVAKFGIKTFYGDATRPELLEAAGASRAKLLILTLADEQQTDRIVEHVKRTYPNLRILARAHGRNHAYALLRSGVDDVFRDTFGSALDLGVRALRVMGTRGHRAVRAARIFRDHEEENIRDLAAMDTASDGYVSQVRQHIKNLEDALAKDRRVHVNSADSGWTPPGD
jgi:monovalent cation:proton antiporter-2 (CPA2) family protein